MNLPRAGIDIGKEDSKTVLSVFEVFENTITILYAKEICMNRYHYKLRYGYEELYTHLPLSVRVCGISFDEADQSLKNCVGTKDNLYEIFTITKLP